MTETLRVDTGLVLEAGGRLQAIAAGIPPPPAVFRPSGADPLSTTIAAKIGEIVDPVVAQLPITKEELTRYALNVVNAAGVYDATDRQLAEEILKRLGLFDEGAVENVAGGSVGLSNAGGGFGAAGAGAAGAAGQASTPEAGAAQQAGQMGQMMQMPMQLAQQAAQIPMQVASMAAAIPQAMMQGVQAAMQQASQLSETSGEDGLGIEGEKPNTAEERTAELQNEAPDPHKEEASAGTGDGERVPVPPQAESPPEPSPAPKPAPTRPAESTSEIVL